MLCNLVDNLISITEDFPKGHKVIETYIQPPNNNNSKRPPNLKTMSPGHLYRNKGLNITQYNHIMRKQGVVNNGIR